MNNLTLITAKLSAGLGLLILFTSTLLGILIGIAVTSFVTNLGLSLLGIGVVLFSYQKLTI